MFNINDIWHLLKSPNQDDYDLAIGIVKNNAKYIEAVDVFLFMFVCINHNEGYDYNWNTLCEHFNIDPNIICNEGSEGWFSECDSTIAAYNFISKLFFRTNTLHESRLLLEQHFPSRIKYIEQCLKNQL